MGVSLFTSQTPVSGDVNNGGPITLGTYFTPAVDGTITHIRWYFPASAQAGGVAVIGALFRTSDQTKIGADVNFANPGTPSAWNQVALASPVAVTGGATYVTAVRVASRYVATTGGASPWPFSNGDLSAAGNAGKFKDATATPEYPETVFNAGCYFVDVVFEAGGAPSGVSPAGLAVPVTFGSPTLSIPTASPTGLAVPVSFGQVEVGPTEGGNTPDPPADTTANGWFGLLAISKEAQAMFRESEKEMAHPVACWHDGEPLVDGHCSYCGRVYPR